MNCLGQTFRDSLYINNTKDMALCSPKTGLGRKIKTEVADNPDQYSLIYLPNPVIVPGGRFREIYYWDR